MPPFAVEEIVRALLYGASIGLLTLGLCLALSSLGTPGAFPSVRRDRRRP